MAQWPHLDLLVNNAGVAGSGEIGEFPIEEWRRLIEINLMGAVHGCHTFIEWLKSHPQRSHVINTASFPGALRELDTVTLEDIDARVKALTEAVQGGPLAAWMRWMVAYHATMRAALLVKARLARSRVLSDELARRAAEEASRVSGVEVDDTFVHTVARPPRGRLNVVVFERLGQKFGVAPDEIWEALFPARRTGRY